MAMYIPASFRVDDVGELTAFIREYGFGTIVTSTPAGALQATHVPLLLEGDAAEGGRLLCHMARANPQWRQLDAAREVLCIFTGPHAYVSPTLYAPGNNVPTWNYTAVHVTALPRIIGQPEELESILSELVQQYESARSTPWIDTNEAEYRQQLVQAIVGIELRIVRVEGKYKLSQNRPHEIEQIIEGLAHGPHADERATARFMQHYYAKKSGQMP